MRLNLLHKKERENRKKVQMLSRIKTRTRLLRIPQTRNIVWFRINSMNLGLPFEYDKDTSAEHYFWKFVQQTDCQTVVDHYDGSTVFFFIQYGMKPSIFF